MAFPFPKFMTMPLMLAASMAAFPAHANDVFHADDTRHIAVTAPALYPEGLDHVPATGSFVLGSIRQGAVVTVSASGEVSPLVNDDRLRSVVGVRVDAVRGRLLIANSDYGVAERSAEADRFATAALGIYDLQTGAPIQYVDLSGLRPGESNFVNDLDVDADGNAYVTDSLAAAIYRITPAGEASVFLTHERFRGEGFNLNGIRVHPDGYLLVAKKSDGTLFKVPLDAPESFTEVALPEPLIGTDGLVLLSDDRMVAIANRTPAATPNTIFSLTSRDGWQSAEVTETFETGDVYATTGTVRDGRLFVSYGYLHTLPDSLKDPQANPLRDGFRIQEVGVLANE
jgi:hypothetical protein